MGRHKILVVDTSPNLQRALTGRLGGDYLVVGATGQSAAIAAAKSERPAVIVLGLGPAQSGGAGVLDWLGATPELSSIPTIVFATGIDAHTEDRALRAGAAAVYHKPYELTHVVDAVQQLAERRTEQNRRVLIVDDDPDLRAGLGVRMREWNYEVVLAEDAVSAIAKARTSMPDLVLLDLGLPGGGGLRVIQRLKALPETHTIPVIVLSAKDRACNMDSVLSAGAEAYLQKPATQSELLEAIGSL
ncbi:MAG: response regulator [Planctomycetota bacterium]